jgi:hypothetical protein
VSRSRGVRDFGVGQVRQLTTLVGMSGTPDTPRPERRLIAMISTEGKSKEQMKAEAHQAIAKYLAARPNPKP